jgi:hypothetical protein
MLDERLEEGVWGLCDWQAPGERQTGVSGHSKKLGVSNEDSSLLPWSLVFGSGRNCLHGPLKLEILYCAHSFASESALVI